MMRQRSLFECGLIKVVEHNGVQEQVVPRRILNYEANNPLCCKYGCGARFSRGCALAKHEKTCKCNKTAPQPQLMKIAPRKRQRRGAPKEKKKEQEEEKEESDTDAESEEEESDSDDPMDL